MPIIRINRIPYEAHTGERLSDVLIRAGLAVDHPCGGRGTCRKCMVLVDGQEVLSCQTTVRGGEDVRVAAPDEILAAGASSAAGVEVDGNCALALDLGTTTLALALLRLETGEIVRVVTANNPQRAFGADVMSRIAAVRDHGVEALAAPLRREIDRMIGLMVDRDVTKIGPPIPPDRLYVAGNTTMLHLFLGVDPTPMGAAPYTPAFLDERHVPAESLGLRGVREVVTLPGFSAFVGADLTAGLFEIGLPTGGRYRLLVDLGTNAEILLIPGDRAPTAPILCTAAAAGPCFEGATISCGMSATPGAICAFELDGHEATVTTIGNAPPRGLCGTGLVDAIAALLDAGIIDETGFMEPEAFYLADSVSLSREDVRQYQLAKSAVHAAIECLLSQAGITAADVEALYIAGGFATALRISSAVRTGLLPAALADRCVAVGNSSLAGTARYAACGRALDEYTKRAVYVDLAADAQFADLFMEGMLFE